MAVLRYLKENGGGGEGGGEGGGGGGRKREGREEEEDEDWENKVKVGKRIVNHSYSIVTHCDLLNYRPTLITTTNLKWKLSNNVYTCNEVSLKLF